MADGRELYEAQGQFQKNTLIQCAVLFAAIACAGPSGKDGTAGSSGDAGTPAAAGVVDFAVLTPDELQVAKITAVVTGNVTVPADGRPVVNLLVTERHGSGVKGLSATAVTWRFALLKLVKG